MKNFSTYLVKMTNYLQKTDNDKYGGAIVLFIPVFYIKNSW